jgi:aldehyde:ferredoxin oxidoreductase
MFVSEPGLKSVLPLGIIEPIPALDLGAKKVRMFTYFQHFYNMFNSIGLCIFTAVPFGPMPANAIVDYVNAATGWETSLWELMKVGERHSAMARMFNLREGFAAEDDTLPNRLFQSLEGGTLEGKRIDPAEFKQAVSTYYQMVGWDDRGVPLEGKLAELELDWLKSERV